MPQKATFVALVIVSALVVGAWTHGDPTLRPVEYLLADTGVTILVDIGSKLRAQ